MDNTFYWYARSSAGNLEEAFEQYIVPSFFNDRAAASAEEDFLEMVERAKKGTLEPVDELKLMSQKNIDPDTVSKSIADAVAAKLRDLDIKITAK